MSFLYTMVSLCGISILTCFRCRRNSIGLLRCLSLSTISLYDSLGELKGKSNSVSPFFRPSKSSSKAVGIMKFSILNQNLSSYILGSSVYWKTALKPTPNLPIVLPFLSFFVELPTPVIALM